MGLPMKGLRTQESEKFNKFWQIVQDEADSQGCVFFGDCGEGKCFETEYIEGEDFIGWLIPKEKEKIFERLWSRNRVPDNWIENMVWMKWEEENDFSTIRIEFEYLNRFQ